MVDFRIPSTPGMVSKTSGREGISTRILRARAADSAWVWATTVAVPLMLLAPALWNSYPLLRPW